MEPLARRLEGHTRIHDSAMECKMKTRLTEAFGIQYPIVCAPMAMVAGGRLAAAVSRAGGLGIVGGGYAGTLGGEPDLGKELAHVQGRKFGVGFITWALARVPAVLDEALTHSPSCVFFSFGDAGPFAERVHRGNAKLICQVQSLPHVDQALEAGATAIVAQGAEAGGHRAKRATGDDTVRTKAVDALRGVPWPDEFSFRVLKNKLTDQWAHREAEAAAAFGSLAAVYAEARSRQD